VPDRLLDLALARWKEAGLVRERTSQRTGSTHVLAAVHSDAAPLIVARFTRSQRQPCPASAACTTSGAGKRTAGFPPRELSQLQARNRAGQQDPAWHKRYAVRSGVEGTACE
jgi:Transposase DDE domain